jgi:undecaprenyl pyrophosphate phosphatase UppP
MLLLKAAVMGVVEGLTEFLPISSTGHLILAGALLGFDDEKAKVFDIAIQTGAIFAVILVYWQKIQSTVMALANATTGKTLCVECADRIHACCGIGFVVWQSHQSPFVHTDWWWPPHSSWVVSSSCG